jgi:hypothetical protein
MTSSDDMGMTYFQVQQFNYVLSLNTYESGE